jgi:hypothetical protein
MTDDQLIAYAISIVDEQTCIYDQDGFKIWVDGSIDMQKVALAIKDAVITDLRLNP